MLSLNEMMSLLSQNQRSVDGERSIESMLLAIVYDISKLDIAISKGGNADKQEINKRVANLLVGSLIVADMLEVKDVEAVLQRRVEELKAQYKLETQSAV